MSGGLSRTMVNLAQDVDNVSGGTPEKGADINAPVDLVDANAVGLFRKGLNALTDATVGQTAFRPPPGKTL